MEQCFCAVCHLYLLDLLNFSGIRLTVPKVWYFFALLTGVWAGLLTNGVNVNRINIVYYGLMMFVVLGVYFTIKEIKYTKWSTLCVYAILGIMLVSTYFTTYADSIKYQFYYGFGDALSAAEQADTEKIYVTADAQGKGYSTGE